jgi:hypothetical protein
MEERIGLYRVWWGNLCERGPLGGGSLDGYDIKMGIQEVECGGMEWIKVALDRDRWRALANRVMNFWVP